MRATILTIYLALRRILLFCAGLFLGRRVSRPGPPDRILVIRWDRIGDMVLSTPVFQALRSTYPDAAIDVLASSSNAPIVEDHPAVDEVIVWQGRTRSIWSRGSLNALRDLREKEYELVVDLLIDWPVSTALLAALIAPQRIGFSDHGKGGLYTRRGPRSDRRVHLLANNTRLLKTLNIDASGILPSLAVPRISPPFKLKRVGIHPGGFYESQRWPVTRWVELAGELLNSGDIESVCLIPDPADESDLAVLWKERVPGAMISSPADIGALVHEIARFDVLLCNNSGPLHIAGAVGVPTLSTLGPTNPDMWWPVGERQVVVQSATRSVDDICVPDMLEGWEILKDECRRSDRSDESISHDPE
ncbi:glycosyltransferase family 9 protein [Candidatus Zixiibacteriota bacterium]